MYVHMYVTLYMYMYVTLYMYITQPECRVLLISIGFVLRYIW